MKIHRKVPVSEVNGPGRRAVIWVQGCAINGRDANGVARPGCPGCWNPLTHSFSGGSEESAFTLAAWVVAQQRLYGIEGVSFSGGEPLHYAWEIGYVIDHVALVIPSLSFSLYSGYSEKELESGAFDLYDEEGDLWQVDSAGVKQQAWRRLCSQLDFAVLGRYNQLAPVGRPLVTSGNQRLKLFNDRYTEADFPPQAVESIISSDGELTTITGFPVKGLL